MEVSPTERLLSRIGFRFRLQTVFVLMTAFTVVLGLGSQELYREHHRTQIALDIRHQHGQVRFKTPHERHGREHRATGVVKGWLQLVLGDYYFTETSSVRLELRSPEDLKKLLVFPEVEALDVSGAAVTDDLLLKLQGLRHLQHLELDCSRLSERGLDSLKQFSHLRYLQLANCSLTNQSLEPLTKLSDLVSLTFVNCSSTEGTLKPLAQCTSLRFLKFFSSPPSKESLEPLNELAFVQSVSFADCPITDSHLGAMHGAKPTVALELKSTHVTEAGMLALWKANPAWSIRFENRSSEKAPITEGGYLPSIRGMLEMDKLAFQGSLTSHETLALLKEAKGLRTLELSRCRLTDGDLQYLRPLENLTSLRLEDIPVTDNDLQALEELTKLETVSLIGTKVTGIGLRSLPLSVRQLRLISSKVVSPELADINKLTSLESLDLGSAQLSVDAIDHLAKMSSLRQVSVFGPPISAALAARLQQALPNCSIMLP